MMLRRVFSMTVSGLLTVGLVAGSAVSAHADVPPRQAPTAWQGGLASSVDPVPVEPTVPPLSPQTPRVTGTAQVGSTLTAQTASWGDGVSLSHQWNRAGQPIRNATAPNRTYRVKAADAGKKITVRVTASRSAYVTTSRTSAATASVQRIFSSAPTPRITGRAWNGAWLQARPGTWSPSATLSYQWRRDGRAISGATNARYRLTAGDAGSRMTVRVTARRSGHVVTTRTSEATASVRLCRVKGNADSGIYHVRGIHRFYNATVPEGCFNTEAQARAAGYRRAKI